MILSLEPHQELITSHLRRNDRAAVFAGMGLGKTSSVLSTLASDPCRALIVAPLRVANLTWPNEIRKWDQFAGLKVENLRHGPPSGKADISLINYESLHKLEDLSFCDTVIFDELTRAKNPKSARITNLRPLLKHHRRWGLTGTPRPNSILELFAQVRLLDDGARLGRSFDQFKRTWCHATDYMQYNWVPNPGAEEEIYRRIHDLAITLRTSDYSEVADTVMEDLEVPLPPEARQAYDTLEKKLLATIGAKGEVVVARSAGILVNKLHQITGGTVYDEDKKVHRVHSAKINLLRQTLANLGTERSLIACNYVHERERICAEVPDIVDASTFRGDIEDAWNSGRIRNLIADPRSLGHGLNMQGGGRTVIWFSPTWSRELYDQFNGRIARKGQSEVPVVYHLLCPDTIDYPIMETLRIRGNDQAQMLAILTNLRQMKLAA